MKKNNKILVTILILLNLLLVIANYRGSEKTIQIEEERDRIGKRFLTNSGKEINPTQYIYNSMFFKFPEAELSLVSFLDTVGCPACISNEIEKINQLFKKYPNSVKVYSCRPEKYKKMAPLFKIEKIKDGLKYFEPKNKMEKSFSCVVGKSGQIYFAYKLEDRCLSKTNNFYKRVEALFAQVYGKER